MTGSHHDEEVLGRVYDARLMRRLWAFVRPHHSLITLSLLLLVAVSAAQLAQPYLMKVAIDQYIAVRQLEGLNRLAALYVFVVLVAFAAEYFQTWTMQLTGQRIMFDLRMSIYRHLQKLDLRYYDKNPVGRLMTRVTSDVDVLNDLFTAGVVTIFGDVLTLVGIMAVMLWMDWRLALVTFAVLPIIVAPPRVIPPAQRTSIGAFVRPIDTELNPNVRTIGCHCGPIVGARQGRPCSVSEHARCSAYAPARRRLIENRRG